MAAGLFGAFWYLALGGAHTLNVTNIGWMIQGDWNMHLFGWLFARNAPLGLPLGHAPDLLYPYGSSLAFADGMPWVGVFFRLLSPALPTDFQPVGLWLLSCFMLQGIVGVRVSKLFTTDKVLAAFTGMILVLCPIVSARLAHPSLCAMWVVLAVVYLNCKPCPERADARRALAWALGLVAFACGIHMYLTAMVVAVVLALWVRLVVVERVVPSAEGASWLGGLVAVGAFSLWILGFIGWQPTMLGAEGFGDFSSDLLTFVNPMGWSRVMPDLAVNGRQGEGFSYLGLGVAGLLLIRGVLGVKRRDVAAATWKRIAPLLVVAVLMAMYALSFRITFLGRPVVEVPRLFSWLDPLPSMFRSSGRFMWVLHLCLVLAALSAAKSLSTKPMLARGIIGLMLALQLLDVNAAHAEFRRTPPMKLQKLQDPRWALMGKDYQHLAFHPMQLLWICRYDFTAMPAFSYEAYRQKLTINSGHVARTPLGIEKQCEQHLAPNTMDPQTVYVVTPQFLSDFLAQQATCGVIEGYAVCVSSMRPTALLSELQKVQILPR